MRCTPHLPVSSRISASAVSAGLMRKPMPSAFRPQKVQWFFSPHQQPREVSSVRKSGQAWGEAPALLEVTQREEIIGEVRRAHHAHVVDRRTADHPFGGPHAVAHQPLAEVGEGDVGLARKDVVDPREDGGDALAHRIGDVGAAQHHTCFGRTRLDAAGDGDGRHVLLEVRADADDLRLRRHDLPHQGFDERADRARDLVEQDLRVGVERHRRAERRQLGFAVGEGREQPLARHLALRGIAERVCNPRSRGATPAGCCRRRCAC